MDWSCREARKTGGRPNEAGVMKDEDILILSSNNQMSTSVTKKVSQMLSSTPAFTGLSGSVDLFQPQTEIIEACAVTPVFEGQRLLLVVVQ